MHPELLLTNIGYGFSILLTASLGTFILLKGRRKTEHVTFFLLSVVLLIYEISHVWGINVSDPELSRKIFMFNTANLFIVAFNAHWVFAMTQSLTKQRWALGIIYAIATGLCLGYWIWPESFMLPSQHFVLYFESYYNIGPLYPIMTLYFVLIIAYFMAHLFRVFFTTGNEMLKARLKYVIGGLIWGYGVGVTALLPLYGIDFDPIISTLVATYTIPFAYSILAHNLWDLNVVARKALWYGLLVAFLTMLIAGVNSINNVILTLYPSLSLWVIPFISALVAVSIGTLVWNRLKFIDTLRYELLQVMMHKFRTPLTKIRWAADRVGKNAPDEDTAKNVARIRQETDMISELVDTLVYSSTIDTAEYHHTVAQISVHRFLENALNTFKHRSVDRKFTVNENDCGELVLGIDEQRMSFALQVLVDNAFKYTREGGHITVDIGHDARRNQVLFKVMDDGIGFDMSEQKKIFYEFYRTKHAQHVDTEGMGLGLFLAQKITERHGGALYAESKGDGKGSVFTLVLPVKSDTIEE